MTEGFESTEAIAERSADEILAAFGEHHEYRVLVFEWGVQVDINVGGVGSVSLNLQRAQAQRIARSLDAAEAAIAEATPEAADMSQSDGLGALEHSGEAWREIVQERERDDLAGFLAEIRERGTAKMARAAARYGTQEQTQEAGRRKLAELGVEVSVRGPMRPVR